MGISAYPEDATDAEELIRMADKSMYRAKKDPAKNFAFCSE